MRGELARSDDDVQVAGSMRERLPTPVTTCSFVWDFKCLASVASNRLILERSSEIVLSRCGR